MDLPAISIKVKGAKALGVLWGNGQVPGAIQLKAVAMGGKTLTTGGKGMALHLAEVEATQLASVKGGHVAGMKALEIEGARMALTKGAILPAAEVEIGGAKVVATKSFVVGAGQSKAAAAAAKGTLLGGWGCYGLGPWGLAFMLSTLGLAAVAYYLYRQNRQLADELSGEGTPD
jgi:hypothetical protein